MFTIKENYSIGRSVTFVPNKHLPIYNWFYYKEGFSRPFMEYAYNKLNVKDEVVMDCFMGSGTTCLYAKERGNVCYGMDVNDVAVLASKVKTRDYDISYLKELSKKILPKVEEEYIKKSREEMASIKLKVVKNAFPPPVLEQILAYKHKIKDVEEEKYRNFFLLALMNTSTITTYAEKVGGSIRINKKRRFPPVRKVFKSTVKTMINHLQKIEFRGKEDQIIILKEDARFMKSIDKDSIDVLITSPPYLNKIEYTNVYAIEQYLFISKNISKPVVRSYIGEVISEEEDVFKGKYPMNEISKAYFRDLYRVVKELDRVMTSNAKGCVVIGNGCFPNGVVESDKLFAELLEKYFSVKEIERVNVRWCMRNRTIKVAPMHESIIWFSR